MEIYLVRHTTPEIEKGICYGQSDLNVSNSFEEEVIKIHQQIPVDQLSQIYSSPLKRCKLLAETFNKPITYDSQLKELNFGSWELKAWNEISKRELDPWMSNFVHAKVPEGESYTMLQKRVLNSFASITQSKAKKIAIISHASPMRVIVSKILSKSLAESFDIKMGFGHVYKIKYLEGHFDIISGLQK